MPTSPGLRIGRILGIPIYVHASWMIIFVLITMSLAMQFTQEHPQWTTVQHWAVGIATSLLFFASVLFHELSHSMVARIYKIRVISITLFVFGGVARIGREPAKAIQEFNIAIAGPLASLFLAAGFYSLTLFFPYAQMTGALAVWLWQTNAALALFNLLPGFPLDGGRIFRAIVWGVTKDFSRATKVAGTSGKVVAYGLIVFGAWYAMRGQWTSGLWLAFIGWFLLNAAQESVAQVAIRETLSGLHAADVMSHEVPTVPRNMSLEEYGQEVARTGRRCGTARYRHRCNAGRSCIPGADRQGSARRRRRSGEWRRRQRPRGRTGPCRGPGRPRRFRGHRCLPAGRDSQLLPHAWDFCRCFTGRFHAAPG